MAFISILALRLALLTVAAILLNALWRSHRSGVFASRLIGTRQIRRTDGGRYYWGATALAVFVALAILIVLYGTDLLSLSHLSGT